MLLLRENEKYFYVPTPPPKKNPYRIICLYEKNMGRIVKYYLLSEDVGKGVKNIHTCIKKL